MAGTIFVIENASIRVLTYNILNTYISIVKIVRIFFKK